LDEEGNTPLIYAARGGHAAIARMILDRPFVLVDKHNEGMVISS
jgi:ankyrin repeat protein